jgi:RNA polymerase sigma-70 factor (ECF subfamily)
MADGDREALAALYARHAPALFAHAVALTRSSADAEDLVQGVFVKVAGMGARLLGIRRAGAYLHRMLRMAFLDGERHRGVAAEEPLTGVEVPAGAGTAEADRLALASALGRLPAEQREAVVLHVLQGLTFREVAAMTGVSTWTAASRYRLGMGGLRGILGVQR